MVEVGSSLTFRTMSTKQNPAIEPVFCVFGSAKKRGIQVVSAGADPSALAMSFLNGGM